MGGVYKSLLFRNIRELGGGFLGGFLSGMLDSIDKYYMPFPVFGSVSLVGGGALSVLDNYIPGDRPFLHSLYLGFYSNGSSMLGDKLLSLILSKTTGVTDQSTVGTQTSINFGSLLSELQSQNSTINNILSLLQNFRVVGELLNEKYTLCSNLTVTAGSDKVLNPITIGNGGSLSVLISKDNSSDKKLKIYIKYKTSDMSDYTVIDDIILDEENNDVHRDNDSIILSSNATIPSNSSIIAEIDNSSGSEDRLVSISINISYTNIYSTTE